jgi:hypothetical protein
MYFATIVPAAVCDHVMPEAGEIAAGHVVACHLYGAP